MLVTLLGFDLMARLRWKPFCEYVCPPRDMLDREVLWRAAATFAIAALVFVKLFGQ